MPILLRLLTHGTAEEIQLDSAAPVPRMGEIIETRSTDDRSETRMEVVDVRYVVEGGVLNAVVECRTPTVGLANRGADTGR